MNHPTYYTPDELAYIMRNAHRFTVQELAFELALGQSVIRNIGSRYNLKFRSAVEARKEDAKEEKPIRKRDPKLIPDPPKQVYERPPAMYSNGSPFGIASSYRKL